MNTKRTIIQICGILISSLLVSCGEPVQKFKVEVVDESNVPMHNVEVAAWFNKQGKTSPLDSYKVTGTTDDKGMVEIKGETVWYQTSVSAQPKDFYKSMKRQESRVGPRDQPVQGSQSGELAGEKLIPSAKASSPPRVSKGAAWR